MAVFDLADVLEFGRQASHPAQGVPLGKLHCAGGFGVRWALLGLGCFRFVPVLCLGQGVGEVEVLGWVRHLSPSVGRCGRRGDPILSP